MKLFNAINISASGLTAQRLRLDTIASNIANAETTRANNGQGPYRRQVVVTESRANPAPKKFSNILQSKINPTIGNGVRIKEIRSLTDEESPFKKVYDPSHLDADEAGYVLYPNINIVEEMVNMISTNRSYDANVQVIDATRSMAMRALNIGK